MRKITSKKDAEKKQKRNNTLIGIILVIVMLFSVIGYGFMDTSSEGKKKIEYNGFEFINSEGYWFLKKGDSNFRFIYNPLETEGTSVKSLKTLENYLDKPLYVSSESVDAEYEILGNLQQFVQRAQYACLEKECEENLPVKTCEENFIIIELGEENEITQKENCVFIKGKEEDILKISDEFLFNILGVR